MNEQITSGLLAYLSAQDWGFIASFLAISFLFNKWVDRNNPRLFMLLRTRYRVFLIGLVYAGAIFALRGYRTSAQAEALLQAYLYSVVFYSLVVDIPVQWAEAYVKRTVQAKVFGPAEGGEAS